MTGSPADDAAPDTAGGIRMISRQDLGGLVAGYILLAVIVVGFGLFVAYAG
jgi:hypothetical protein